MNRKQLHGAALRNLQAAVIHEHPPGETGEHLLALVEALAERSPLLRRKGKRHPEAVWRSVD
jgi:hypothetical protein